MGLIGNWKRGKDLPSDFRFNEPTNRDFVVSRYDDAPIKDYEEINQISEHLINEKNLDQMDDITIYWEGGVSPALRETEEPRRRIFGISYKFEDGIYYIARIKDRFDEIKFLYAFTTEIPNYQSSESMEVCKKMKTSAEEVGLKFSRRTSYLIPVVFFLEDQISFEKYRDLESNVKEFKKKINLPLFNSRRSLRINTITGEFIDR